jgi:hypothetical protein
MIDRFACLPRAITRRKFGRLAMGLGAATGAEYLSTRKARATVGTPFTIVMVPDPQWLAGQSNGTASTCATSGMYGAMIQWAITNRNMSVNGVPLNIKGFIQVGDCVNACPDPTIYDAQQQISVNAYAKADGVGASATASPKMFVTRCPGNHDYAISFNINKDNLGYMWRNDKNGAWSPTNVAAAYSGGMDLGSGDVATFGGVYPDPLHPVSTANNYVLLNIQGMKIAIGSVDCCAGAGPLNWLTGIQQAHPDYQWWLTTHCYMNTAGARIPRSQASSGPADMGLAGGGLSNSGIQMWGGGGAEAGDIYAGWAGLQTWPNLTGVFCGHWIDGYAGGSTWVWQRSPDTSTSSRGQTVQQLFCDCQGTSGVSGDNINFCGTGSPDGTSDVAHLMLLRITPATQMMEAFLISTNSGKYTGTVGVVNSASPIQLFSVPMRLPRTHGMFPMPSSIGSSQ